MSIEGIPLSSGSRQSDQLLRKLFPYLFPFLLVMIVSGCMKRVVLHKWPWAVKRFQMNGVYGLCFLNWHQLWHLICDYEISFPLATDFILFCSVSFSSMEGCVAMPSSLFFIVALPRLGGPNNRMAAGSSKCHLVAKGMWIQELNILKTLVSLQIYNAWRFKVLSKTVILIQVF